MTKGVISNGIFSRSATILTGLALSMVNSSFHGSILMRPPRGRAARTLLTAAAPVGFGESALESAWVFGFRAPFIAVGTDQLLGMRSAKCGMIRFGTSFARYARVWM